jgi:DNA-binding Lrp family transcriptional regulator
MTVWENLNLLVPPFGFDSMSNAIVLINSEVGYESDILEGLCDLDRVERACLIYGVYDILAEVSTDSMGDLEDIIAKKIRMIPGVRSTLTLIISKCCK